MQGAIPLATASGISWGCADFIAGRESRGAGAFTVALISQLVSGALILVGLLVFGVDPTRDAIVWGAVAGALGGVGILAFYHAMSIGALSLVTPVASCGVAIPVLVSFARGERAGMGAMIGMALAVIGILLVARTADESADEASAPRLVLSSRALAFALLAAIGFGCFFVVLDHGAGNHGIDNALWATAGARVGSVALMIVAALVLRQPIGRPHGRLRWISAAGIFDMLANALYAIAATAGTLAIVAVLGSMYPVVTVLLARVLLHERIGRLQNTGVFAALVGVALMAGS